jgi:hypothetical protein
VRLYNRQLSATDVSTLLALPGANYAPLITLTSPVGGIAYLADTTATLILDATVTDDGLPLPSNLTTTWSQINGPGPVTFGNTNVPSTTAMFPTTGVYQLRLTADNGQARCAADVVVVVNPSASFGSGLTAYWKFDETNGDTAFDSSGNGLNAYASSTTLWTTNGYVNGAVNIAGVSSNFVDAGHPSALNNLFSTGATVSAWINTTTLGGGSLGRILDKNSNGWILYQNPFQNGVLRLQFEQAFTTSRTRKWIASYPMPLSNWVQVTVCYNSSSSANIPIFYVNGAPSTLSDISTDPPLLTDVALDDATSDLYIGNREDETRAFGGIIDDVRIYNQMLTPAEASALAVLPTASQGPVVAAGTNQVAVVGSPITLTGIVTDDGAVTTTWSELTGPGTVTFGNVNATNTTATFSAAGVYTLELTANDGQLQDANDVNVTVYASAYDAWAASYGLTGNAALPNADPFGKGISNTNQFLLGLNPTNPASTFRITSVVRNTTDVVITWETAGVRTNVVQATGGDMAGDYTTNGFADISGGIIIGVTGDTSTNYADAGAATNSPSRYYRIRLGP